MKPGAGITRYELLHLTRWNIGRSHVFGESHVREFSGGKPLRSRQWHLQHISASFDGVLGAAELQRDPLRAPLLGAPFPQERIFEV